jgi:phenylalanine-4-hydroxylase
VRIGDAWKPASELSEKDFQGSLEFESGIEVSGRVLEAKLPYYVAFENCTVRQGSEILYRPEWGPFDLALGSKVVSVFGGAGDRQKYLRSVGGFQQKPRKPKTNLTEENRALNGLYADVRMARETSPKDVTTLEKIASILSQHYSQDWLLRLELVEIAERNGHQGAWIQQLNQELDGLGRRDSMIRELIERGRKALAREKEGATK